jgi:hypothetical protein
LTGLPLLIFSLSVLISCSSAKKPQDNSNGWISLFDGKTLNGWKASESQNTFRVENGYILAQGPRSHLYYDGPVMNHNFKNFEFKVNVMTKPDANSGIYFQTKFQPAGYPDSGFEVQVNNSSGDWKKTGCLYDIKDFGEHYAKDNEWFTVYIKVQGKNVIVKVNDKQVIDWTQPDDFVVPKGHPGRYISSGTFAFQEHDAKSIVYFKDIMVKPLPD